VDGSSSYLIQSLHLQALPRPVSIASHEVLNYRGYGLIGPFPETRRTNRCNNSSQPLPCLVPSIQEPSYHHAPVGEPESACGTVYSTLCNHAAVDFLVMKGLFRHSLLRDRYHDCTWQCLLRSVFYQMGYQHRSPFKATLSIKQFSTRLLINHPESRISCATRHIHCRFDATYGCGKPALQVGLCWICSLPRLVDALRSRACLALTCPGNGGNFPPQQLSWFVR
jgi:hypothetical protein